MKKIIFLLFVIFAISLISCDTTEVVTSSSYSVKYVAGKTYDIIGYFDPQDGQFKTTTGSGAPVEYTIHRRGTSGDRLQLTVANYYPGIQVSAKIIVNGKIVRSGSGLNYVNIRYTLP